MGGWVNGRTKGQTDGRTGEWVGALVGGDWISEWISEWKNRCIGGWMDGWMDGWTDGRTDGLINYRIDRLVGPKEYIGWNRWVEKCTEPIIILLCPNCTCMTLYVGVYAACVCLYNVYPCVKYSCIEHIFLL